MSTQLYNNMGGQQSHPDLRNEANTLAGDPPSPQSALFRGLQSANIPALDGLRALAVFLVIFYHFGFGWVPGGLGVLAFFVLSGFLITWLLLKENQKQGNISLSNFYMRRVLRIFPAFYVYWFGFAALLLLTGRGIPWRHAISSFFYLGNYYNAIARPPDSFVSHTWSLAIEEQFYLLWPTLLFFFRRDLTRLTKVLAGLIGFVWVYRAFLALVVKVNQSYIYNAFDTRLDHLMVGCLVAVLLFRGAGKPVWSFLSSRLYLPAITLGLLIASVVLAARFGDTYRDVIGFTVDPLLVAVLLVQLVSLSSATGWKWINWSWVRYLGRISYSLYLYQEMTLYPARRILAGQGVIVQLLAAVAGTILIASASFYLVEKPFLRLKSKFEGINRRKQSPARSTFQLQPAIESSQPWNAT